MEYFLHIKPTFDCLIKIANLEQTLNKNKTYSFLVQEENLSIIFYPIKYNSYSLPFCYKFEKSNPICNKNIEAITFPQNNYFLKVNPFYIGSNKDIGIKSKTINFANSTHTLFYSLHSNFFVKIENNKTSNEFNFDEKISTFKMKAKDNNLVIFSQLENKNGFILLHLEYQNEKYTLQELSQVDILEESLNTIKTYKNLNDISHHGEVTIYNFITNFLKTKKLVYQNNLPFIVKEKQFVPFAFFEAVKLNNYKLARSYLDEILSKKLTDNHIKKFFGVFSNFCLPFKKDIFENEISLIYENIDENNNITKYAKNYTISLNSLNQIDNILEND